MKIFITQGRETPSPGETPNMCRQRSTIARSTNSIAGVGISDQREINEMECGHLLSTTPTSAVLQLQPHSHLITPAV